MPAALDPLSQDYIALAFAIERQVPGYVDAYVGPPDVREAALVGEPPTPETLEGMARALLLRVAQAPDYPDSRVGYLTAQIEAMLTTARQLGGEQISYPEEVRRLFDVEPEQTPETRFEAALAELDQLLPGEGPVQERMTAWQQGFEVPPETVQALIEVIVPEIKSRTAAVVELPADEAVEFALVSDKPWSGYNWYLGEARSRVEINTDLPVRANVVTDLLCHEAYPGHHTEHALKEMTLYREAGYGEHAIQLINTPECVIAEGIATLATGIIFPGDELHAFEAEVVYPAAGLTGDPEREARIARARQALRGVDANAALLLHDQGASEEEVVAYLMRYGLVHEARARQKYRFLAEPLWRAYTFTYHAGRDLLDAWLEGGDRVQRFRTLLTEQVYPSQVARWIEEDQAGVRPAEPGSTLDE